MTTATDEYYRDIIEGLALYTGSALQRDVLATITRHAEPDLGGAFNKNQIASKMWLADALLDAVGPNLGEVAILGGWFGVLAAVLLHDPRFAIDTDPEHRHRSALRRDCAVGERDARARRPVRRVDRRHARARLRSGPGARARRPLADLVINTSCEHLAQFDRWYERVPDGTAAGPAVERLFRLRPARQLRCPISRRSAPRRRCATCSSPASAGCAATSASC